MTNGQPRTANMTVFVIQFILAWAAQTTVAVAAILYLQIDPPEATSLIITMAAAAGVGSRFAGKEGRPMANRELLQLAGFGTLICFVLGTVGFAIFFLLLTGLSLGDVGLMLATAEISGWTMTMILLVGALVSFAIIYLAAGGFSWLTAKRMSK